MQLPVAAQSTMFAAPWEAAAGPAELLRVAQACDRAGFFYVAVCDHVAVPRSHAAAMSTTWYDAIATLGWLAASTRSVRLLSYVWVAAYRHPLQTAKAFATVDALSGGRVILGVGAGHLEGEFAALGVDFTRRGALLDDAIDIVAAAFRDEFPDHDGRVWRVHDVGLRPRPVQRPRPPIWVGGSTPAALRRAAARGDGWLPQGTFRDKLPAQIAAVREHRLRVRGDVPIEIGGNSEWLYVGTPSFDLGPNSRSGSPDAIAASLRELHALGVSHCGVRFRTRSCDELVDQIDAFAADVMPLLPR
jgi:probable F420-dependent oxidoreductase